VKRVLITGMSATGKSTAVAKLAARGYRAVDLDEPGWSHRSPDGDWVWNEPLVEALLAEPGGDVLFVSGCAESQIRFHPQFELIVLLSAPTDVLVERLRTRTTNRYGKRPEELAEVLRFVETVEPRLRRVADVEIDASAPLERVLEQIVAHATAPTPPMVWGRRSAFNVQKVLWLLDELGVDYRHRHAGGAYGGLDEPAFRAMNPHGRVPVLKDGDTVVWESHAVLRYLAAAYGGECFWPAAPTRRAPVDGWMDWAQTTLQPDFIALFWRYYRTPPAQREAARIEVARAACERHFALLDQRLGSQPYLAGAAFSLADIPAGTTLYRYCEMGLDVARPANVMRWYERLARRPGYNRHVMVPFDELRGRLEF
jgi:glutathione S-transferase